MVIKVGQTSPYIRRFFVGTAVLATALIISVFLFGAIGSTHSKAPPVVQPPPDLLPGNPLPKDASCLTAPYPPSDNLYCYMTLDDTLLYFMFSSRQQTIARLSYSPRGARLGDLVLAWGTPSGMNRLSWSTEIHWNNRVVYVVDNPLAPDSRILYIAHNLVPERAQPWRGFTNHDN